MATRLVAKPNEEQPKCFPYNFARGDVGCSVRSPQRRMVKRMRLGQRTLQPLQAIVALADEGNVNVYVAGKTPISGWRRIDR